MVAVPREAVVLARAFELFQGEEPRGVGIQHPERVPQTPELLVAPSLEQEQRCMRRGIDFLKRDASTEVHVEGKPCTSQISMETDCLRSFLELVPITAVRAILVHGDSPCLQRVPVLCNKVLPEGVGSLRVWCCIQPRRHSPDVKKIKIFLLDVLLVLPVKHHGQHLDLLVKASCLALLDEVAVGELLAIVGVQHIPNVRVRLRIAGVVRPSLEVRQELGTVGI
mmetsp:Transcript_62847/g.101817  ORF Transcript_62847/g.101817 Transcript_62847/m.101817 type:complete len:224 (+) Transcript_62847:690-1361(+)